MSLGCAPVTAGGPRRANETTFFMRGGAIVAIPNFHISSPQGEKEVLWKASRAKITDTDAGQDVWHSCFRGQLNSGQMISPPGKFHSKLMRIGRAKRLDERRVNV